MDMTEDSIKEIKEIESVFFPLVKKIRFSYYILNPVNLAEEKELFLENISRGKKYNPQYKYRKLSQEDTAILNKANHVFPDLIDRLGKINNNSLALLLEQVIIGEMSYLALFIKNRDKTFRHMLTDLFSFPDKKVFCTANEILLNFEETAITDTEKISAKKFLARIKNYFSENGLVWSIKIDAGLGARFAVNSIRKEVILRSDDIYTEYDFLRFVVHEINTHIFRSENGYSQPFLMFAIGLNNYLRTEEGLAIYMEQCGGILTNETLKIYAGRAIAASHANLTFHEIFTKLFSYFGKEIAFQITHRIKRGLEDTALPGGLTKDYIYLQGKLLIEEYLKKNDDIEYLYSGKIAIDHIPLVKKLINQGVIRKPKFLPSSIKGDNLV